ncbi:EAL domain-containing protein [Oleidesulfovibrio alaskensis]|jgi:EAL domain-containing protein (putative c-di-GMP-specific phosphodiesterase class I)|uniref:EAL domain-containing protein n=1 Tax=Oleidesulfovibrio alaskensis TaxID=58180 RepID=UPI000405D294|nr:EAL domain-containing protein [Oleidesulfovibrio alaskensis]
MNQLFSAPVHGRCPRCEGTPERIPDSGVLYICPPIIPSCEALRRYLQQKAMPYTEVYQDIFAIPFDRMSLEVFCEEYLEHIGSLEQKDTRSLLLAHGEELTVRHVARMRPLETIVARLQGEWLIDMLDNGRLETHFQPIVNAASPADVHAYECLARGIDEDGAIIGPARMFGVAKSADLLFNLDRACRLAAIDGMGRYGLDRPLFINFNPATIYNPVYCLQTTMNAISKAGLQPDMVVFEVVESDEVQDVNHLLNILRYYRDHGFKVALDDLGAGFSSLNLLARLKPDYVKLDMGLVHDVHREEYKAVITGNLLAMARGLGIKTIAEGVETEGEWRWLAAHGADYVQGFLFARPAAPPDAVKVPCCP